MKTDPTAIPEIDAKIYLIRGQKVMLDFDLAGLYQSPPKVSNNKSEET